MNDEVEVLEGSIISESSLQIAIGHSPDSTIEGILNKGFSGVRGEGV